MTADNSLFENLKRRRVLQIVGMYVAATWLVIELGDWVTERFGFSSNPTSYVFIVMLVMLPAVIMFVYNHGAPGRDKWTAAEKVVIPLNIAVALGILYFSSSQLVVEAATETVRLPDETGAIQEFEVARQGYHKNVIGYFWQNETDNEDLQWLSYGLPLMLAHDLNRVSPVISVATPFDSYTIRNELRRRGYDKFLNEPQALQVEIARDRRSAALIVGSFKQSGIDRTIDTILIDAENGEIIGAHSATAGDWLAAADEISFAVLNDLDVSPSDNQSNDPIKQHLSGSLEAIKYFTNGRAALAVDNDYPQGIAALQMAMELDPDFAEAGAELSMAHYFSGDIESARITASDALSNSYRLAETSKFVLKANSYIYDGDFERGERVLDVWVQVQPDSTAAYSAIARLAKIRGGDEALEKANAAYDRLLELDPNDYGVFRDKAEVEQQRGDYPAAVSYIRRFLAEEPDSGDAHRQLANLYQAQGDLDAAQASLEDAAILSDDPLASELGLGRLEARRGLYGRADARFDALLNGAADPRQQLRILVAKAELALVRGQIEKCLALHAQMDDIAVTVMPPMMRLVRIKREQPTLLVMLGRTNEAIALADEITAALQPPLDAYMNFTYTTIYGEADNDEKFREWAAKSIQGQDRLPEVMRPFVEMVSAQLSILDRDFETAVRHLDSANQLLDQSVIQLSQDNLSVSALRVVLADMYLDANAIGKSQRQLEGILKVFPADAFAKSILGKVLAAQGNTEAARDVLSDALEIWDDADDNFIHKVDAIALLASLQRQ